MTRLLIYDSEITGHHSDYLRALLSFICTHPQSTKGLKVILMVPEAMQELLSSTPGFSAIGFSIISSQDLAYLRSQNHRKRSFFELGLISEVVTAERIDKVFLMNIDYFQVAVASREARKLGCEISGILFQPYTRFEMVALERGFVVAEFLRTLRKRYRLTSMLRNPLVKRLCVPTDQSAVDKLSARYGHRVQIDMLPEPYFVASAELPESVDIRERYGIAKEDRIILVFGHMIARKNVPNLLQALRSSRIRFRGGVTLLVIGNAAANYREKLEQEIMRFNQAQVETSPLRASAIFDCGYADSVIMNSAFAQSDFVAMPYFKAYQSSGVLFIAVSHAKPVLTANVGLMNELVKQYDLGLSVDPHDPDAIAIAIDSLLRSPIAIDTNNHFFKQHTPNRHAACILGIQSKLPADELQAERKLHNC